ncbi:hypothetical protein [Neobacillus bataviensis]|uniref:hypothetical protein n=1 Tax=Neobacillus bataviensis TaxID=220685 RepID=UPI0002E7C922|nr:hypothetical protein [Neobacillus bataviensis]
MFSPKKPILTDQFLDELAKEISLLYGNPEYENKVLRVKSGVEIQKSKQNREE